MHFHKHTHKHVCKSVHTQQYSEQQVRHMWKIIYKDASKGNMFYLQICSEAYEGIH